MIIKSLVPRCYATLFLCSITLPFLGWVAYMINPSTSFLASFITGLVLLTYIALLGRLFERFALKDLD